MTEYLQDFKIPVDDLSILIKSNLSSLPLSDIENKNTKFFSIAANITYVGTGRSITRVSSTEYSVENDPFSMSLTWTANVSKTIGHNTYKVIAKVSSVPVSYHKAVDITTGMNPYRVTGTNYVFSNASIEIISISPDPGSQKTNIMALMPNLFTAIDQQFKSIGNWLNDNAKKQSLGTIYGSTYTYEYYEWKQEINEKQISIVQIGNETA